MGELSIKKVLIFGSTGMAGHVITRYLESLSKYRIIDVSRSRLNDKTIIIDVKNGELVKNLIIDESPDIVINCIGTLIKESEEYPDLAIYINSYFPHFLEKLGILFNFKLIHLSTDCVFSGEKGGYLETDFKDGKDFYSRSKALGEVINNIDLTFRTSFVGPEFKKKGSGLFHWFMSQTGKIYGYNNVYWTGITTLELAKSIDHAIDVDLKSLYHLVPENKISKYQLIKLFKEIWDKNIEILKDKKHISDKSLINSRKDFNYKSPDYRTMLIELSEWMKSWDYKYYYK